MRAAVVCAWTVPVRRIYCARLALLPAHAAPPSTLLTLPQAVVCVQSDPADPRAPRPVVARSRAEVLAAAGVKATLSPSLSVLPLVEALVADGSVKRLCFIGVGCQVQALRAIEPLLGLERLYVLGTNCADNGPRAGLDKFLDAASAEPGRVTHYEFAQVRAAGALLGR